MATIIRVLRTLNNDSQKFLAELTGNTVETMNRKENGKVAFTLKEAEIIAKRYNVPIDVLVKGEETKEKIMEVLQK